jgi:predicted RNA-binding Zn-ribbon protein involved in translation (DUF1610 family)
MTEAKLRMKVECPECGCGLIDGLTPDIWQEKYANAKPGDKVKMKCPNCGQVHDIELEADTD